MLTETKRVENHDRVVELLNSVERDGISDLLKWLEESDFFTAPASRAYHGAYIGGLCEHSLNVYDEAKRLLSAYPEVEVSDETVIISALLHDLCKVNFYATEKRNRKNSETGQWESYDAFTIKEKEKRGYNYSYADITSILAKITAGMKKYGVSLIPQIVPGTSHVEQLVTSNTKFTKTGEAYEAKTCRSFLTPYLDENRKPKYYGRFNQGVVTINLPDVGLSAVKKMEGITYVNDEQYQKRKEEIFWEIFEERLELCHRALRLRHERLLGTLSDASPIHWQNGGLARLKKGETIDKLLYGGYSTLSLGYAGLYECVKAMTGKSHTDDEAKPFALAIMQKMNDKCAEWKAAENIDYSLYGTPIESTTYKFAKCLQKRFGVIEGITDRNYITNSYHVHVTEKINAFDKLRFESEFQLLSPGGAISYIETANLSNNVEAAIKVIQYIYDHIMYAELNTKSDFCQECGYDGEIQIVENEDGKYIWECPNCGNRDRAKMNIARRTCGYIGVNDFNQGRTQEIKERYVHLGGE